MLKYAIIGNNIQYSKSPEIYNFWFNKYNIGAEYSILDVPLEQSINNIIREKIQEGFLGFNITKPYKEVVLPLLSYKFNEVKRINSVNTIKINGKNICGYNTDYLALLDSFSFYSLNLNHKNILILGAGGAAKSLIYALNSLKLNSNIFIYNRTEEKLKGIKNFFPNVLLFNNNEKQSFDVVFNATTVKTTNLLSNMKLLLKKGTIIYNLNYNMYETLGDSVKLIDGFYMLLSQASYNFKIWFNTKPIIDKKLIEYFQNNKN